MRNPPPPAGRLEFTPQAGQPNGNKKLRQTALPTPRRPGNIAPTTPVLGARGSPPTARGASPRLASSRFQRDASVDTSAGHIEGRQGSPRVALSDANCLCSNCLRVTPLEQSPNCSVLGDIYSMEILAMKKMLHKYLKLSDKLDNERLKVTLEFTTKTYKIIKLNYRTIV